MTVAYWIFNYMPEWEAASKEAQFLLREHHHSAGARLFSLDSRRWRLRVFGREKHIPLTYGFPALPLLYILAKRHPINHLFASPGERIILPWVARFQSILTISKETNSVDSFERNRDHLARFRYVVVERPRHLELLRQLDITNVTTIYPPAHQRPYRPARSPFTVLFASSPLGKHNMLSRGVLLLIKVAQILPHVQFILAWRRYNRNEVESWIANANVENITVVDGVVDMSSLYDAAHVAILPGLDYASFKPSPHSAIESLAHGKPVLLSRVTSLADIVSDQKCGVVFEPTVEGLEKAIVTAMNEYETLQRNCHTCIRNQFSPDIFLKKYRDLYHGILSERSGASCAGTIDVGQRRRG